MNSDTLILTAASRRQARAFALELRRGHPPTHPILDRFGRMTILPDSGGRRIGSGASTLLALWRLTRSLAREGAGGSAAEVLQNRRTLIIHCGGDSRRLPLYAGLGKVFIPVRGRTMFDLIVEDLHTLLRPGRVLVASGDVFLGLAGRGLRLDSHALAGVAFPGSVERASRHGVYIADKDGGVRRFLQKPDAAALKSNAALDEDGRALIDTGVLSLEAAEAARWLALAGVRPDFTLGEGVLREALAGRGLDLYAEMLPGDGGWTSAGFGVEAVAESEFLHVGTTREVLERLCDGRTTIVRSEGKVEVAGGGWGGARRVFVDACRFSIPARLAGENVVVGVPASASVRIDLPRGWALGALPIDRDAWACLAFGVDDDFKTPSERGGTIGGRPLAMAEASWGPLWREGEPRTLWEARLWIVGGIDEVMADAARLVRGERIGGERWSIAALVKRIDPKRLVERGSWHRSPSQDFDGDASRRISIEVEAASMPRRKESDGWPLAAALAGARSHRVRARRGDAGAMEAMMACIADAVGAGIEPAPIGPAAVGLGSAVWAEAPVRIDLAGGWSDTPPICLEHGGTVLNMAVLLDGRAPIRAMARLTKEPCVRIRSIDLGAEVVIRESREAMGYEDPRSWDALPKAALVLCGICPTAGALRDRLEVLGGGVELTISSGVPKGSGLGTSSILGATVLACLDALLGTEHEPRSVIRRASVLEQMMRTGGGWQDQAGGVLPGVKLLETSPGGDQVPSVRQIALGEDVRQTLAARTLLYYTGKQRMARDILQNVVGRYLDGEEEIIRAIEALRAGARRTADALEVGDIDAFAAGVANYWSLKRRIDPGSTTPEIEAMVDPVRADLSAYELAGAGGGGFLYLIAHDELAAKRIAATLAKGPGRVYAHAIDRHGLRFGIVESEG